MCLSFSHYFLLGIEKLPLLSPGGPRAMLCVGSGCWGSSLFPSADHRLAFGFCTCKPLVSQGCTALLAACTRVSALWSTGAQGWDSEELALLTVGSFLCSGWGGGAGREFREEAGFTWLLYLLAATPANIRGEGWPRDTLCFKIMGSERQKGTWEAQNSSPRSHVGGG